MTAFKDQPPRWCIDIIDTFRGRDAQSPQRIAALTQRLAESGEILEKDRAAADVASTGGPASLTTFVPPLILASNGIRVPKIGVPGRPAGVIDTLGTLPGYKTALSRAELQDAIRASGFGNTLSTGVFAPEDSVLFRARQQLGMQSVPALVIASLLSKKLAAGLTRVMFDVRTMVGGNFGQNTAEAHANIQLLKETAALVGITAHCVVTDGQVPSQPMVGRAEALRGLLALLDYSASPWLERHFVSCTALTDFAQARSTDEQPDREKMRAVLDLHLQVQGAKGLSAAEEYLEEVERTHQTALLYAPAGGHLSWDMAQLRAAVVSNQSAEIPANGRFPDTCGVELFCGTGARVDAGDPVARVRGKNSAILRKALEAVGLSLTVTAPNHKVNDGGSI
ncbi:hypothetical protein [Arthrobacter sp. MA-N2]|uniref:hypothetical protein n=1 Tax=Arthrobacter sp. MA-N2 TaxID=1101188 RepID=UPI00047F4902|nr:hypothetical protein [Arthrobacter sp. MA-N2]